MEPVAPWIEAPRAATGADERPSGASRFPGAVRRRIVATLFALFALQVILTSWQTSPASDEAAQLPAGYAFLKTGLWYLLPEHPPLIPARSAAPLLPLQPRLDLTDPT